MADPIVTTYTDTDPRMRMITDVISLIDPYDTPLITNLGGLDGATGKFNFVSNKNTYAEWLEDTLPPLSGALTASLTTTDTSIGITGASAFKPGDILMLESEGVYVTAAASDAVTVTRAFIGSAASHASTVGVSLVGEARLEGADYNSRLATDKTLAGNYTQIFSEEVKATGTMQAVSQFGIADELEYQARKVIPHIMRIIERNLFTSVKGAGTATTPRTMGGLDQFITASTSQNGVSSTAVNETAIRAATKAAYTDGGTGPWIVPVHPDNMDTISALYSTTATLRVERTEEVLGMKIGSFVGPFGTADFVLDRWAPKGKMYFVDPAHAGFLTLRPFQTEDLPKTSDAYARNVLTELTFCIRQANKAHAVIYGIT